MGLAIVALLVLFVVGVKWYAERKSGVLVNNAELDSRGLYLKLSMKKASYNAGEPIDIQLLVRNISDKDVPLHFDTNVEFDFTVQSELDLLFTQVPRSIWQHSSAPPNVPKPQVHTIHIAPGKEKVFRASWKQQTFGEAQVKPGRYIITGYLKSSNHAETLQLRGETGS